MFSFPTRPDGSWPSACKKLAGLQRAAAAPAISFAAIAFSRSSSHLWRRHLHGRRCLALSPEGDDRCWICAHKFPIEGTETKWWPSCASGGARDGETRLCDAKDGKNGSAACQQNSKCISG